MLRIIRIETFTREYAGLLRITAENGVSGWGQIATYESADLVVKFLHRQIAECVLGMPVDDIEGLFSAVLARNRKFPGSFLMRGFAAIETALWDLRGKNEKKLVTELLGGSSKPVPVYGSSMSRDIGPTDEARRMAELQQVRGYRAFKIRIGDGSGENRDRWPGRTAAVIAETAALIEPNSRMMADANGAYRPTAAVEVGCRLADHGFVHYEEPCPHWKLDWTRMVSETLTIDVAGGEQDNWFPVWKRIIDEHVVDIVQPDICYAGGILQVLKIAESAAAAGIHCVPHAANHSLISIFTMHVWNSLTLPGQEMEFSIEEGIEQERYRSLYKPALEVVDGMLNFPQEDFGWGIRINPVWLEKACYQESVLPPHA